MYASSRMLDQLVLYLNVVYMNKAIVLSFVIIVSYPQNWHPLWNSSSLANLRTGTRWNVVPWTAPSLYRATPTFLHGTVWATKTTATRWTSSRLVAILAMCMTGVCAISRVSCGGLLLQLRCCLLCLVFRSDSYILCLIFHRRNNFCVHIVSSCWGVDWYNQYASKFEFILCLWHHTKSFMYLWHVRED